MNNNFKVSNFRVFDEKGVEVKFKPITIITGKNCSGKSSLVKSVFLIDSFMKQIKEDLNNNREIDLSKYKLDFTQYPNNLLGSFDNILNSESSNKKLIVEYSVYSNMLSKEVYVELSFAARKEDVLNNGYLIDIKIKTDDGIVFAKNEKDSNNIFESMINTPNDICNLNIIKKDFLEFLPVEFIIHNFLGLVSAFDIEGVVNEKDFTEQKEKYLKILKEFDKKRVSDIFQYARTSNVNSSIIHRYNANPIIIDWTKQNDSLFKIQIVEDLDKIPKKDIRKYIKDNCCKDQNKSIQLASDKIIDDYLTSKEYSFKSYFRKYEIEQLEHATKSNIFGRFNLVSPQEMDFDHNYLAYYPENWKFENIELNDLNYDNKTNHKRDDEIAKWLDRPITFGMLYEIVMTWNNVVYNNQDNLYYGEEDLWYKHYSPSPDYPQGCYKHFMYKMISEFMSNFLCEVLGGAWNYSLSYVSTSRAVVKRFYNLDSKDDFANLLHRYFENRNIFKYNSKLGRTSLKFRPGSFINEWIRNLEIGEKLEIKRVEDGIYKVFIYKTKSDKKGHLLADEGYGITQLVSLLLEIETTILTEENIKVRNWYGQEYLNEYHLNRVVERKTIAIEEPEIHFHPGLQSKLTELFYYAYVKHHIEFIIETHSEYLVRKSQVFVHNAKYKDEREMDKKNPFVTIYFTKDGDKKPCYDMKYRTDGAFYEEFGIGFYDVSSKLSFNLFI